jgi:hypothetical protein
MAGAKMHFPPNRNHPVTHAGEVGKIVRDIVRQIELPKIDANFFSLGGGTTTSPGTTVIGGMIKGAETAVAVGAQSTITLIVGFTGDVFDTVVVVNYRTPNGNIIWPANHSRIPIANTVVFYWTVAGGDLVVTVINDTNINILATPWFCDDANTYVPVAGMPGDTVVDETAFGQASDSGASPDYSRKDHTHGTPAAPGAPAHNLLSVTHTDSTPAAAVRGDIIVAQGVGALWTAKAAGGLAYTLTMGALEPDYVPPATWPIVAKNANYVLTLSDYMVAGNAGGAGISIQLPTAVGNQGKMYCVKKVDAGIRVVSLIVLPASGQTIDGLGGYNLAIQWQVVRVISDGANWLII